MRASVASVVRAADVVAIGDLAGEALAAGSGLVQEMHEAIADRPFGALGRAAGPVRAIHDGIAHTAYASVRTGLRAASRAGAAAAAIRLGGDRPALAETRRGTVALAALNAVYGDRIADRGNGLALEMEIRGRDGGAAPSPRIVVFIHGLGETERSWGYAAQLEHDLGVSAVTLRYNTGLAFPTTAARWPGCSTSWSPSGRAACSSSRWSGTRWAVWSPEVRATTAMRRPLRPTSPPAVYTRAPGWLSANVVLPRPC